MTRKKRGFWTFCFSLIPGAGEMYLGFMKRGVSMMCLFLGGFAFCGVTGFSIGMCLLPVMWFYSFFQVHNLVSLPDEEFYQQEDDYLFLHMDKIVGVDKWERGKVKFIAAALIFIGGYTIVNTVWRSFWNALPDWLYNELYVIRDGVPRIVISLILIAFGVYLIRGKKEKLDKEPEVVYDMPYSSVDASGKTGERTSAYTTEPGESCKDDAQPTAQDVIVLPDTKGE